MVAPAPRPSIPAGVDGEALTLSVPVRCEVRTRALRVLVPRRRPGMRASRPRLDWRRLARLGLPTVRDPHGGPRT
ncbi:hypothetical protein [Streptomyces sp. NPDC059010]|uniref:hypothetical protein n=1 Tax=Streptomyces sp. NPDC059010 TaxID=3346695 RepID=UPI00368DB9A6